MKIFYFFINLLIFLISIIQPYNHMLSSLLPENWKKELSDEIKKNYFIELEKKLESEYKNSTVFPEKQNIFKIFECVDLSKIKVVLIGQDPYHAKGQAVGLSFSVPKTEKIPSSLRNIFKELKSDIPDFKVPENGNLEKWTTQGIFLLNTTLTVQEGKANSHSKYGWNKFTDTVIKLISDKCDNVVFLLWGNPSKEKAKLIDEKKHLILTTSHPSGLSCNKGFFGCKHFSKCNEYLLQKGKNEIDWNL
jgi:uracil-DNA glycosylase